jgi:uncharacterized protein (TIGR03032 family)
VTTLLPQPPKAPETPRVAVHYEHTPNLAGLLAQLGVSLLVSTYQAGKVLTVGVHRDVPAFAFYNFEQVMGLAPHPRRLAVGARRQVWFLQAAPELAPRVEPAGSYDACYLTRSCHFTGPIHVHEMDWAGDQLWVVNTLFSCLCTLGEPYSFVPRWKPPFVTALAGEDRCHLNGMALGDGVPRYVTVLGQSDTPGGWREAKAHGGCILEVPSGRVVATGLAMPHSPRWQDGVLWVLDSGRGQLCRVDPLSGKIETVARLDGYTRGLALHGRFAFVGLSKIRETSVFGGIPIAEDRDRLRCGVQVIDLTTGLSVAGLYFNSGVEEIFDVKLLPGVRCPGLSGPLPDADGTPPIWLAPPPSANGEALK